MEHIYFITIRGEVMQNKCFNCRFWFSCKRASSEIKNCEWFKETNVKEVKNGK